MYRHARLHAPGTGVHVISRFINRDFRLAGEPERSAFLKRLPQALARADWRLLGYALMSSHVHLALLAGEAPPWVFLKPLRIGFARWVNRAHAHLGPVFAHRPTSVGMGPDRTAYLLVYLHNNPVRAHVVGDASQTTWTSHRAYLGLEPPPAWLAIDEGLRLCGFDASDDGRQAFHEFVCSRLADPRDPALSGATLPSARKRIRQALALPVELAASTLAETPSHAVLYKGPPPVAPRWQGAVSELLRAVAEASGVTVEELCSRSRERRIAGARRLLLVVGCRLLRRDVSEVASAVALSSSAASHLLRDAQRVLTQAQHVAEALRQ